ncbi:hypothetical protein HN51_018591, partial [Arachis hypogaea]
QNVCFDYLFVTNSICTTILFSCTGAADLFPQELEMQQEFKQQQQPVVDRIVAFEGRNLLSDEANKENLESHEPSSSLIKILETEFECLPGYMKGLATWEEEIKEMEREQIREGIDEFGILYSELSDSNRSEGSNGSFAFLVLKLEMDGKPCKYA